MFRFLNGLHPTVSGMETDDARAMQFDMCICNSAACNRRRSGNLIGAHRRSVLKWRDSGKGFQDETNIVTCLADTISVCTYYFTYVAAQCAALRRCLVHADFNLIIPAQSVGVFRVSAAQSALLDEPAGTPSYIK